MTDQDKETRRVKFDGTVNLGIVIQIAAMIVVVALAWATFDRRTTILELQVMEQGKEIIAVRKQTNRIERYLQANDPTYWRKLKENGESTDY